MKAFVDANVLLRFITKRPPKQAERAKALLQRAERGLLTLLLTPLVVAEVLYVLEGVYTYPRERAGSELKALCLTRALTLTEAEATLAALDSRINRNIDFVDAIAGIIWFERTLVSCQSSSTHVKG